MIRIHSFMAMMGQIPLIFLTKLIDKKYRGSCELIKKLLSTAEVLFYSFDSLSLQQLATSYSGYHFVLSGNQVSNWCIILFTASCVVYTSNLTMSSGPSVIHNGLLGIKPPWRSACSRTGWDTQVQNTIRSHWQNLWCIFWAVSKIVVSEIISKMNNEEFQGKIKMKDMIQGELYHLSPCGHCGPTNCPNSSGGPPDGCLALK